MIYTVHIQLSLFLSSFILACVQCSQDKNQIRVLFDFQDEYQMVNISSCVSIESDDSVVRSLNVSGTCAMLYNSDNCGGNDTNAVAIEDGMTSNNIVRVYGFLPKSVGPCRGNCPSSTFEKRKTEVTIYDQSRKQATHPFLLVPGECETIPKFLRGRIGFADLSSPVCLEFYESEICQGESKTFNFPDNNSLSYELLPRKWHNSSSVSLCGFNCIGSTYGIAEKGKKSVSLEGDSSTWSIWVVLSFASFIILCTLLVAILWLWRLRKDKSNDTTTTDTFDLIDSPFVDL